MNKIKTFNEVKKGDTVYLVERNHEELWEVVTAKVTDKFLNDLAFAEGGRLTKFVTAVMGQRRMFTLNLTKKELTQTSAFQGMKIVATTDQTRLFTTQEEATTEALKNQNIELKVERDKIMKMKQQLVKLMGQ